LNQQRIVLQRWMKWLVPESMHSPCCHIIWNSALMLMLHTYKISFNKLNLMTHWAGINHISKSSALQHLQKSAFAHSVLLLKHILQRLHVTRFTRDHTVLSVFISQTQTITAFWVVLIAPVHAPTKGWPGWVDTGGSLRTTEIYFPTLGDETVHGHPSQY